MRSLLFLFIPLLFASCSLSRAKGEETYAVVQREGLKYAYIKSKKAHILEIDPHFYDIKVVKALDRGVGRESTLSIAKREGAIAAINGGFFAIGGLWDGRACGVLKIHQWYALSSKPRGCIGWSDGPTTPLFDRLLVLIRCQIGSTSFVLDGLNREGKAGEAILFTPIFSSLALGSPDRENIIIQRGGITAIQSGSEEVPIAQDTEILSIGKEHPLVHSFQIGTPIKFEYIIQPQMDKSSSYQWAKEDYIVGGTPLLIQNGREITDFSCEKTLQTFLERSYARTAIGLLPNGHWLFVVVDRSLLQGGMSMGELAHFLFSLGCNHALNLDGGGSSTFVYDNQIINCPRGDENEDLGQKKVRKVSDAIIVIPKDLSCIEG